MSSPVEHTRDDPTGFLRILGPRCKPHSITHTWVSIFTHSYSPNTLLIRNEEITETEILTHNMSTSIRGWLIRDCRIVCCPERAAFVNGISFVSSQLLIILPLKHWLMIDRASSVEPSSMRRCSVSWRSWKDRRKEALNTFIIKLQLSGHSLTILLFFLDYTSWLIRSRNNAWRQIHPAPHFVLVFHVLNVKFFDFERCGWKSQFKNSWLSC